MKEVKIVAQISPKQELFVQEYLIDLNQTQAAIRAGYSVKSAAKIGSELMEKPSVRDAVAVAMAIRSRRTGIKADRVLRELARVAFVNAADVIDFDAATVTKGAAEDDTAAIASIKVKIIPGEDHDGVEREIKLADKVKSLELLGKHLGMFTDKLSITGELPVKIIDDVPHTTVVGFHTDEDDEAGDEE